MKRFNPAAKTASPPPCDMAIAPRFNVSLSPETKTMDRTQAENSRLPVTEGVRPQGLPEWRRRFLKN
jgi:hypothetical protein